MTTVPVIINNMFNFGINQTMGHVSKEMLIPSFGLLSSIVNNPDFSARTTLALSSIGVIIVLFVVSGIANLLIKVVKKNKVFTVISSIFFLMSIAFTIYVLFISNRFEAIGIHQGFWFYGLAVVMCTVLLIIESAIIISMYEIE